MVEGLCRDRMARRRDGALCSGRGLQALRGMRVSAGGPRGAVDGISGMGPSIRPATATVPQQRCRCA